MRTISVREAADIAAPTATWREVAPGRPAAGSAIGYLVAGPLGADARLDLDGDGMFDDAALWCGPAAAWPGSVAVRATDADGDTVRCAGRWYRFVS
jgi:hypothetical protein